MSARFPGNGRIAWLTGASEGIGAAVVRRLAAEGWTIAASARGRDRLDALAASTARVHAFPLDVTDRTAVMETVATIEARLGPIDLAILNAGTHRPVSAREFDARIVEDLARVNLFGVANGVEACLAHMLPRGRGHLALVASLAGLVGLPSAAAYAATKAAVIAMAESLKPELDDLGIKLQVINPGFVDTPLTRRNDFDMPFLMTPDAAADAIVRGLAARRFAVEFPWRLQALIRLLRLMPEPLRFAATRGISRARERRLQTEGQRT